MKSKMTAGDTILKYTFEMIDICPKKGFRDVIYIKDCSRARLNLPGDLPSIISNNLPNLTIPNLT